MNAIEAKVSVVQMIPIDLLDENPLNPRRTIDESALEELAQSIRVTGINQPLLVRPQHIDGLVEERYEIVCGHRRSEAATMAGKEEVPCIVREMTDQEAAEIALVDNLQRVDVAALEEAEAFGALLALHGTVEAVAKRVGKDVAHVAKRLKLRALGLYQRDALHDKLITVDHALLLARLGVDEQDKALKWALDTTAGSTVPVAKVVEKSLALLRDDGRYRSWEPESVVRLREHIEQSVGRKLSIAPWGLDDASLVPDAGACSSCPSNTKANQSLFGDLDIEEATCADGGCFEVKRSAFVEIQLRKAGHDENAKPPVRVPRLSWKSSSVRPATHFNDVHTNGAQTSTASVLKILRHGQWVEAKKNSCPNVRTGITVDWEADGDRGYMGNGKNRKPGEALTVCIAVGCKVHRKEYEKPKSTNNTQREDPAAAKKRQEEEAHVVKIECVLRDKVMRAILGKIDAAQAVRMVADDLSQAPAMRKQLLEQFPKISGDMLEAFVVFLDNFSGNLRPNGYWLMQTGGVDENRKTLWALAKRAGLDADAIVIEHFDKEGCAPWSARLYPKGKTAAKKSAKSATKKAAKPAAKPAAKKTAPEAKKKLVLDPEAKKRIADAVKKRWATNAKKKAGGK